MLIKIKKQIVVVVLQKFVAKIMNIVKYIANAIFKEEIYGWNRQKN